MSRKPPHYPISNLFLIVLLYIVEAKKGCKKNSLNILSLAADLLKRGSVCFALKILWKCSLKAANSKIFIWSAQGVPQ